ncbi:MAG: aldehyde dehydrogenase family protein [Gammaproteobacteria bacterium]|nr:aldehyde dehydrogenase family protein [Gammaproteobacteria bacterium]
MSTPHKVSQAALDFLAAEQCALVGGRWLPGEGGQPKPIIDPAESREITRVAPASAEQADDAAAAARAAFLDRRWSGQTPAHKQRVLLRVAELIERDARTLAELETLNGGKLFAAALHGEVAHAAETFRYYAGWCTKLPGATFDPSVPGQRFHGLIRNEPIGVAAQIVPWNGPLVMAAWKLAPALAAGCSCILKPAELTPLTALYLGRLLLEAGVPEGVVSILPGPGGKLGQHLARHPQINKVAFTGSTEVGKQLLADARGNLKRLSLELGGKSPVLIFDDADLRRAIAGAADAIFANAGQVCVAGSRVYVERGVYQEVLDGLADTARGLKLGPGLDPDSQMGPLISASHRESVHALVEAGVSEGAQLVTGGEPVPGDGFFYPPTVFAGAGQDMRITREEVFGPVVTVTSFDTADDAVRQANHSRYGLAASVWTRDLARGHEIADRLESGIVWINSHGIPELSMPIGGYKQSGWGREHGLEGLKIYMETKSIMARMD